MNRLLSMIMGLFGRTSAKSGNSILDALLPMLMKGGALGGLAGLLNKFRGAGLGAKADSWVSTGANEPLETHEVEAALGSDTVSQLATQAGVSKDEATGGLAKILPSFIDKLTPGGSLPTEGLGKLLKGFDFTKILSSLGK